MPVEEALERLLALAEAAPIDEVEVVALADAEGRVLANDLFATLDLPPWPNSAMDGYALRLADWQGEPLAVSQRIFAGHAPQRLQPGTCARIFTGAPCPKAPTVSKCRKTPKCWTMAAYVFSRRWRRNRTCAPRARKPALASR